MTRLLGLLHHRVQLAGTLLTFLGDSWCFLRLCLPSPTALAAENLFLRKQLTLYQERHIKLRWVANATRIALVWLSRWFDSIGAGPIAIVRPETFLRRHRQGLRLF